MFTTCNFVLLPVILSKNNIVISVQHCPLCKARLQIERMSTKKQCQRRKEATYPVFMTSEQRGNQQVDSSSGNRSALNQRSSCACRSYIDSLIMSTNSHIDVGLFCLL